MRLKEVGSLLRPRNMNFDADGEEEGDLMITAQLRQNVFSNIANYFIKRSMIKEIYTALFKESG